MDIILIWRGGRGQSVQREAREPRSRGGNESIMYVEGSHKRHKGRKILALDQRTKSRGISI